MDHLEKDCFLKLPSYDRPFEIFTDYSGQGIGGVLMQKDENGERRPLQFASRSLTE